MNQSISCEAESFLEVTVPGQIVGDDDSSVPAIVTFRVSDVHPGLLQVTFVTESINHSYTISLLTLLEGRHGRSPSRLATVRLEDGAKVSFQSKVWHSPWRIHIDANRVDAFLNAVEGFLMHV